MSNVAVFQTPDLLSRQDIEVLRNSKFKNFTDVEIEYASRVSALLQLNPILNQIHFVKRKNKDSTYSVTAQVGIDGFRLSAQRAGGYAGSDDAVFDTESGRPGRASVTVYRMVSGQRCPFVGTARWAEYYPGDTLGARWQKMPFTMLAKCAEALALRKAFPQELAGLRTEEEMEQAEVGPSQAQKLNGTAPSIEPDTSDAEIVEEPKVTQPQIKRLFAIVNSAKTWTQDQMRAHLFEHYGLESTRDLTRSQYEELCDRIESDG